MKSKRTSPAKPKTASTRSSPTTSGYWPGWLTCSICGITDPAVMQKLDANTCRDTQRCNKVLASESLGGEVWPGKPE